MLYVQVSLLRNKKARLFKVTGFITEYIICYDLVQLPKHNSYIKYPIFYCYEKSKK